MLFITGGTGGYFYLWYSANLGFEDPYPYKEEEWDSTFEREYPIQYAQPEMDRLLAFYKRATTTDDSGATQGVNYSSAISELISNLTSQALGTSMKVGNRVTSKRATSPEVPLDDIYSFSKDVGKAEYGPRNTIATSTTTSTSTPMGTSTTTGGSY